MSELYIDPSRLYPTRLGPQTPPGLFLVYSHPDRARWFYITDGPDKRWAIAVEADERWAFEAWDLDDNMSTFQGVSIGTAEIQVDALAGVPFDHARPPAGAIWIGEGGIHIGAKAETGYRTMAIRIGDADATDHRNGAAFPRWRFFQRDHAGRPVTLLEVGAPRP